LFDVIFLFWQLYPMMLPCILGCDFSGVVVKAGAKTKFSPGYFFVRVFIYTCVNICVCAWLCAYVHTHIYMYAHVCTYVCSCICEWQCTAYEYSSLFTYTYICIYRYTFANHVNSCVISVGLAKTYWTAHWTADAPMDPHIYVPM